MRFLHALIAASLVSQAICALEQNILGIETASTKHRDVGNGVARFPSLIDVTIDDLNEGLGSGLITSVDLVRAYLERIQEVNDTLHVVTEINPDALDIAASLDEQRARGVIKGPLHGIPIIVKNNIATDDKMNTTAGSWLLLGAKASRDATTVLKLRKAGAIILGKANLSQWAQSRSSDPVRGWSAHGGQTYAAYYEKQDPGGSSSGSGVASDLGLALATLGTETDGSIIFPSHKNGIVGIKPTVGLTSRHMVIPLTEHQDTVGPMARTVKDAATILQVIAGYDPGDNYTSAIPDIPDYVAACDADALRGARIGVPWNIVHGDISSYMPQEEFDAYKAVLANLTDAGVILVTSNFSKGREANETAWRRIVASSDLVTNLGDYVKQLTHNAYNLTSLADIRDETQKHPLEEYPARDTGVFDRFLELGFRNDDPRVWPAYQKLQDLRGKHGMFGAMDEHSLDALVMPSAISSSWAAVVGAPIVTVPLGHWPAGAKIHKDETGHLIAHAPGVPMGLSFMGRKWSEEKLIGYAYAFEQRSRARDRSVERWVEPRAEVCDFAECVGKGDKENDSFGVGVVIRLVLRMLVE